MGSVQKETKAINVSIVPLPLSSEPRRRDENGIVVAVIGVLVSPCRLTLALLSLLPGGLRSPAAPRRVLGTLRLTPLLQRGGNAVSFGGARRRLALSARAARSVTRRLRGGGR